MCLVRNFNGIFVAGKNLISNFNSHYWPTKRTHIMFGYGNHDFNDKMNFEWAHISCLDMEIMISMIKWILNEIPIGINYHKSWNKVELKGLLEFFPSLWISDGSGVKNFWTGSVQPFIKFFNFFLFRSKKISLGRVKKYPDQRRVCLLFTVGQK